MKSAQRSPIMMLRALVLPETILDMIEASAIQSPSNPRALSVGSGRRFRDCCHGRLPGNNIGEAWRDAAGQGKWAQVLLYIRAGIVQYTIWHLSHTPQPQIQLPHVSKERLLFVDIEALSIMWQSCAVPVSGLNGKVSYRMFSTASGVTSMMPGGFAKSPITVHCVRCLNAMSAFFPL